jgi:hypothetical protein
MKDGVIQTLEWTKAIEVEKRENFDAQARSLHMFTDGDGVEKVGGYFRHASNFTLVVTPKAGHMVAASQVYASKSYVSDLIHHGVLTCGGKTCTTFAESMCDYMSSCNGHGSCNEESNGQCVCHSGWFGADCSIQMNKLEDSELKIDGTEWNYFK